MIRRSATAAALVGASVLLPQAPAQAAGPAGLAISVPVSANLGSATTGSASLTGVLGDVTVTTGASLGSGGWVATVSATNFTTGGGTSAETIPASSIGYLSGAMTSSSGVAANVCVPGQLVSATSLGSPKTAFSCTGLSLLIATSLTWRPTIVVSLSPSAVAGSYSGTILHSVA
ncbi:MAG: hypothetical protein QOD70_1538 [Frankiales bacterium]|nr:hypothetical protein [Frankiales bacterium]